MALKSDAAGFGAVVLDVAAAELLELSTFAVAFRSICCKRSFGLAGCAAELLELSTFAGAFRSICLKSCCTREEEETPPLAEMLVMVVSPSENRLGPPLLGKGGPPLFQGGTGVDARTKPEIAGQKM